MTLAEVESLCTILAILIGGWWSWRLYRQKRQRYPHVKISHEVFFLRLPDGRVALRLTVTVTNIGSVLIRLSEGRFWIQQLEPVTEGILAQIHSSTFKAAGGLEIEWPLASDSRQLRGDPREIEPYESDSIHVDFILSADTATINAYSYLSNEKKTQFFGIPTREIGWRTDTIHHVCLTMNHEERLHSQNR